jgi:hypothetical protein
MTKKEFYKESVAELIDELVDTQESALGRASCPFWRDNDRNCTRYSEILKNDDYSCDQCKQIYFELKREELYKKYKIKLDK